MASEEFASFLIQLVSQQPPTYRGVVGRVGVKTEPAGKVRLFMMFDSISQRLLYPLHKWVFGLLSTLPWDGTFAQTSPIKRLKGIKELFSFDLKSATDRIPIIECAHLLYSLLGYEFSRAWLDLMARVFEIPAHLNVVPKVKNLVFGTGLPLGSLSSWAIFTLFHHLLVQQAAYEVTRKEAWFDRYAILGDDLVIGDPRVAARYRILLEEMDVSISVEKSIVSVNGSLEFASRFIYRGVDVSPISFRMLATARMSVVQLAAFFTRLGEFRNPRFAEFIRVMGAGYRITAYAGIGYHLLHRLPKRWFRLWLVYYHPLGSHPIPWEWWFGRGKPLPVGAIGVLHHQLLEDWFAALSGDGLVLMDQEHDSVPWWEEVTRKPWLESYLQIIRDVAMGLIMGHTIDPLLSWYNVKTVIKRGRG